MTKAELEEKLKEVTKQLEIERARPTGHTVSGVNISMNDPNLTKIAVAEAVKEGMIALQKLENEEKGDSYGMYFGGQAGVI